MLDLERVSVTVPPLGGRGVVEFARAVEELGFGGVWTNDQYHSAFVSAGAVAASTERLFVGTAVAQAFVRSPLVTAQSALDVAGLAGGRFRLGLGSGVRRLVEDWHGVAYGKPAARLRECAELVRRIMAALVAREPVVWRGAAYQVSMANYEYPVVDSGIEVPIYLTGVRPGMVQVAAEVADGFLGHPAFTPKWIAGVVRPALRVGSERRVSGLGPLRVVARVAVAVGADAGTARDEARRHVAELAIGRSYEELFANGGFGERLTAIRAAEPADRPALVTEAMVDAFTVAGTPSEAIERLAERMRGVDELLLSPVGDAEGFAGALRLTRDAMAV